MPDGRPNVVIIQADQLRWDCLGATGNPDVATPHLDRLAADGITYTEAFCPYPVCTPSRYSLLSGLYPHQHRAYTNHSTLDPAIDTFPRALRRLGYRTAGVGKMHFTPTYLDVGYDRLWLAEQHGPGRYDDDYHRELRAAGLAPVTDLIDQELSMRQDAPAAYWKTFGAGPSDLPEEWHSTTRIGDRAVEEVRAWGSDDAHLLHVSFVKPHHPFDPPAGWVERYAPDQLRLLPGWTPELPAADAAFRQAYFDHDHLDEPTLRTVMAHYYATISQLDAQVGRLIAELRERDLYRDSLIVFVADHGEYLGFHHLLLKDGPMYDPVVKVPMLVKLPGNDRAGEHSDALASLIDVAPTVLSVCGAEAAGPPPRHEWVAPPPSPAMPGLDLTDAGAQRAYVFATDCRRAPAYLARSATHKLLITAAGEDALFDLRADPYELANLVGQPGHAAAERELRDSITRWALFDALPKAHLDEQAAIIDAPNVQTTDAGRRDEHRAYFADAVTRATGA